MFYIFLLFCIQSCLSYNWHVSNNDLYLNNNIVKIKGINWYGFETGSKCVEGLTDNPISYYLDNLVLNNFNALRIPISQQMVLYDDKKISNDLVRAEPFAYNLTSIQILDLLFKEALVKNILILVDIHRLKYGISSPLWYIPNDSNYTYDSIIKTIDILVDRYKSYPNFLGIDLFNEPHYMADYGSFNISTDWKIFIEHVSNFIFPKYKDYSFLFFVNGIDWGKNLSQYGYNPPFVDSQYLERIILSPHLYGPTLTYVPSYTREYLYNLWDNLFGYLKFDGRFHVCVGEWGGRFNDPKEKLWLDFFSEYLNEKGFTNNFFWALNPYSKDVSGLMYNWTTFNQEKLDFLANVQKYPSYFSIHDNDIFVI